MAQIPEITNYQTAWQLRDREHILPARSDAEYYDEGVLQASAIQSEIDPNWTVLDYGSGTGRVIRHINAKVRYALDVSAKSLEQTPKGINQILSDGRTVPLEDNTIDFVYSLMVLQHCTKAHHHGIVKEIVRVLKPGGVALIQLPKDSSYYTQTSFVNVYQENEVRSYVPEGTTHDLTSGSLSGYADKIQADREWILKVTKCP